MLILTRKNDEEIVINSEIVIKILTTSDGQVKIGISAPKDVQILRGEIYQKVKDNNLEAVKENKQKIGGLTQLKINKLKGSEND